MSEKDFGENSGGKPEKPAFEIVELGPDDWEKLRDLKLRSLEEEPIAFEDPEEGRDKYLMRTEQEWREILQGKMSGGREGETTMVFAQKENQFVGMVSAIMQADQDVENKTATIQHMYVSGELRGQHIGRELLIVLIEKLKNRGDLKRIVLQVLETQGPAINLYKSLGFLEMRRIQNAASREGKAYSEIEMELSL